MRMRAITKKKKNTPHSQCETSGGLHQVELRSLCVNGLKVLAKILKSCGGESSEKEDVDPEKIQMQDDLNDLGVVELAISLATCDQEDLFRAVVKFMVQLLDGGNLSVQVALSLPLSLSLSLFLFSFSLDVLF